MNTKTKLALGLTGLLAIAIWKSTRKKGRSKKVFTAPDGFTYKKNQIYRTADDKFYKNGKQIHFNTPPTDSMNGSTLNQKAQSDSFLDKKQYTNKDVIYHSKGVRHH